MKIFAAFKENPCWNRRIATGLPAIEAEIVFLYPL